MHFCSNAAYNQHVTSPGDEIEYLHTPKANTES